MDAAVTETKQMHVAPMQMRDVLEFQKLVRDQVTRFQRELDKATELGRSGSRAPGMLEHRVSPRLEWLTDLGYLSKQSLPKNGFEYKPTDSLGHLGETMNRFEVKDRWADEVALSEWRTNPYWEEVRQRVSLRPLREAIHDAYSLIQRRIGPSPLREVAFIAALLSKDEMSISGWHDELIAFAQDTDGVTVSRGRFKREPENIFIGPAALEAYRNGV